ncbi:hypothetical protein ACFXAZ_10145 [Streptomyces sp. NPDC059477]|uniref:hypothetical protein n=1 Tax=Streptomyces sp. NPDC059477 TaxID=3346847 RepID=UPI0036C8BE8B
MSRVRLHELAARPDGTEWIVGRPATGTFVAVPEAGKRALDLLGEGLSTGEAARRLEEETGHDLDVADFVDALVELGFVAEVDGRAVPLPDPPKPTLPRIRPAHVRWTLSPLLPVLIVLLIVTALIARPEGVALSYRTLLWSEHGSLVLAFGAASGWALLLLHELAHLVTARATGVPARMRLGTRLQFLVMQTDISGIELAPGRHRMTAYLAGIGVNLAAASAAALAAGAAEGTARRMLAALTVLALLPLPFQLMVFMRTDLYFVLQDLTRCRDLYGDGRAYARYAARRLLARPGADPSRTLPAHERRAVRLYSVVLVLGTALCLAFLAAVTLPADIALLTRAARTLTARDRSLGARLDAAAVLITLGGIHVLWARTWWRRRRERRRG